MATNSQLQYLQDLYVCLPSLRAKYPVSSDLAFMTFDEAHTAINETLATLKSYGFSATGKATKKSIAADNLMAAQGSLPNALNMMMPAIGAVPALTFTRNTPSGREPKGFYEQLEECRTLLATVRNERPSDYWTTGTLAQPTSTSPLVVTVTAEPPTDVYTAFRKEVARLRAFCYSRDEFSSLDSMRVTIDGLKAVNAGLPLDGVLASMQATWPQETRQHAKAFVPQGNESSRASREEFDYVGAFERPEGCVHGVAPYVTKLLDAGLHIWLYGPHGTGKSSAARYAAEALGLDYFEINLSGALPSAVKGKDRLNAFVESEAIPAFRDGGLLCLEEFDAAHPTVATALNSLLAGPHWANDTSGERYARHPDFRCIVTANTLGTGADMNYTSRNRIDAATLDRFTRVYCGLDTTLEDRIADSMIASWK